MYVNRRTFTVKRGKLAEAAALLTTGVIHHITLTVSDIERSTTFYTRFLGFQMVTAFGERVALSNGRVLLVLTPPNKAFSQDRFDENRIGLDHVSFAVDSLADLESAAALLPQYDIPHGEIHDLGPSLVSISWPFVTQTIFSLN